MVVRCRLMNRIKRKTVMVTEDEVLTALGEPQNAHAILQAANPEAAAGALQVLLLRMRDEGKVKFDIVKGNWRKA